MMKNRSPEFTIMYDYIHALSEKLGVIDRISQRVAKEQSGKFVTCTFKMFLLIKQNICKLSCDP